MTRGPSTADAIETRAGDICAGSVSRSASRSDDGPADLETFSTRPDHTLGVHMSDATPELDSYTEGGSINAQKMRAAAEKIDAGQKEGLLAPYRDEPVD